MRGYTKIPNELLDESDLSIQERYLYCVMLRHCGNKDTCFPSHLRLGKILGVSDRYIRFLISSLEKKSDILSHKRSGWNRANTYTLSKDLTLKRNQSSYHLGSMFPIHKGNSIPTNNTYLTGKGNRSLKGLESMRKDLEKKGILKRIT